MMAEERNDCSVSVIMPVYGGASTIKKTLESLFSQSEKFDELIIVNDMSEDRSSDIAREYLAGKRDCKIIENEKRLGLAGSYNRGIRESRGELIITIHQDIILEAGSLEKLIAPFSDSEVVAASHIVAHPLEIWNRYNFWQKCAFSRLAGKDFSGIDGKFDAFRKSALLKVGLFDEKNFRTAGEDGDIVWKLQKIGKISATHAKIVHLHKIDPNFSWKNIIRKHAQYSEAQGALLARGRIRSPRAFFRSFFREILLVALAVPYARILSLLLIAVYSFLYTKLVFQKEYRDKRILVLPFLNIFLLLVSFFYSLKGFFYGKQQI